MSSLGLRNRTNKLVKFGSRCISAKPSQFFKWATARAAVACAVSYGFILSSSSAALSEVEVKKLALLIANSAYREEDLRTPANDAQALEEKLRSKGFKLDTRTNLDKSSMRETLEKFTSKASQGDIVFFYFSGYGLSSVGETFLLPVDAAIGSEQDIWQEGVSLKSLLSRLNEKAPKAIIVAIDAARRFSTERRFRSSLRGLEPSIGTENTLTIYSASPGKVFDDASANKSLFGKELAEQMGNSNFEATKAFNRIRLNVARESNRSQIPLVTSTLAEEITFSDTQSQSYVRPNERQTDAQSASNRSPRNDLGAATFSEFVGQDDEIIRDCDHCPELVRIPPGTFKMGSKLARQKPRHTVSMSRPFAIGRFEVTFDEWDACVDQKGCDQSPSDLEWGRGRNPVMNVSWLDAQQYVKWLSEKTLQNYRLPTEAEWEYAARAGTRSPYFWGNSIGANNANCRDCNRNPASHTQPVGSYAANSFGLFDTSGNIAEWVEDCWNDNYRGAPDDGSAWRKGDCRRRVLRGGSFDSTALQVQTSWRFRYDADVPYYSNGFRVVRELR